MTNSPGSVLSAAPPRVCSVPPYRYSHGDDAIDQAELSGLDLYDWQRDVLRRALGERDDGKWSAFEVGLVVGRQQGKGAVLEARSLAGLLVFEEELILWSAHEYKTALQMFKRVHKLVKRLAHRVKENLYDYDGVLLKVDNTNGEEGIERLDTGARIQFIARSKNAGRGFSADCVIWDEAFALTNDQVDAQMPTILARPNPQVWYASSPPLDPASGAQLFRVRKRGIAGSRRLAYFEWGAEGCLDDLSKVDLDDREVWQSSLPSYAEGRVPEEAVEELRDGMSDAGFAREVLCIWPPDLGEGFRVIPEADWSAAEDGDSQIGGRLVFAPAVSLDRATSSIGVAGLRGDGLRHIEVVDARPGTGWVVARIADLVARHKSAAVVVDEFGPTGSLIPELEAAGVEVTKLGTSAIAKAFGMFYDAICGDKPARTVRHIGQPELTSAVAGAAKRPLGEGSAWDRRHSAVDLTPLVSVTNALYGLAAVAPEEQPQPFFAAWR